ncbi:MOSC domain-containing protein [Nocardioides gansuensis]|uniref:MOSC domain-containing protein n=1 Tax=Nocardioides gansuensis TaxID=2138300 RepID=UPI0014790488|nr:MOSC domain-containing protein [Nocardioides gansuensis]
MRLTGIAVHPVKSTAIRPLPASEVLPRGLADDRSWIVVDGAGAAVTAREAHALLAVVADTPATWPGLGAALRLRAPGLDALHVGLPAGDPVPVRLFSRELRGIPAGVEADAWLCKALGRDDLRLVWCDDPTRRRLNPVYTREGDHTAYADGYPVTLASTASLARLNDWVAETAVERGEEPVAVPMERFRPNLVVDGNEPFAEDGWSRVQVGEVRLRMAKPSDRCVLTTVDLDTLETGKEPIRTLARHRRAADGTVLFAVNLIPETTGRITLGDEVTVLD